MPSELGPVVRRFGLARSVLGSLSLHSGPFAGVEVVATKTGIGTERATQATTNLLDATRHDHGPSDHGGLDHVMVVGIAGGIGDSKVGDLVLPAVVRDHASDREYRSSPLHGRAAGTIVTSDEFLIAPDLVARLVGEGVVALDMETSAVGAVCEARGVAWSAVRAISDRADDYTDDAVLGLANPDGSPNLAAALRYMLRHPGRVPRLARLARDSKAAAVAAADEAASQIEQLGC